MFRQSVLPRWKGFNLTGMSSERQTGHFDEEDFQLMSDWGFNFARLPLSYILWIEDGDEFKINEDKLMPLDEAVRWGKKYGIHINIAFHRGPGYCINNDRTERLDLWKDQEALDCFVCHWETFARRYKGSSYDNVSFNMLNEPFRVAPEVHSRIMRTVTRAIHKIDPGRLCILDGIRTGHYPIPDLGDLAKENVAQSCRAYIPFGLTHYRVPSADRNKSFPYPTWPVNYSGDGYLCTSERLDAHYRAWAAVAEVYNMGVHCGEGGTYSTVPHEIALRWLEDCLTSLKTYNIGYAQWNFKGPFGILDSGRMDVDYVDYKGHKLDKKMLNLLIKY